MLARLCVCAIMAGTNGLFHLPPPDAIGERAEACHARPRRAVDAPPVRFAMMASDAGMILQHRRQPPISPPPAAGGGTFIFRSSGEDARRSLRDIRRPRQVARAGGLPNFAAPPHTLFGQLWLKCRCCLAAPGNWHVLLINGPSPADVYHFHDTAAAYGYRPGAGRGCRPLSVIFLFSDHIATLMARRLLLNAPPPCRCRRRRRRTGHDAIA